MNSLHTRVLPLCVLLAAVAGAEIDRGGITRGMVTSSTELIVGGIVFDTESAHIEGSAPLVSGQVVEIVGPISQDWTTGFALQITAMAEVSGPVEWVNPTAQEIGVLGQRIVMLSGTVFGPGLDAPSAESIDNGSVVSVSGFRAPDGAVYATRVALGSEEMFEVCGTLTPANGTGRFRIGSLVVDLDQAQVSGFGGAEPAVGDRVALRAAPGHSPGNVLAATSVERVDLQISGLPGDAVWLEGIVTRFAASTDFDVSGTPIVTDANTLFLGGAPGAAGNEAVAIRGTLGVDGLTVHAGLVAVGVGRRK